MLKNTAVPVLILAMLVSGLLAPGRVRAAEQGQPASTEILTQWDIWEHAFTSTGGHAWYDFPMQVTFSHSDGTAITVDAYYDGEDGAGGQTWLVRFTPTRAGTWQWNTSAADASLLASGSFEALAPDPAAVSANPNLRGHIRVEQAGSRPGRYFVYADGTPFFWLGDTAWNMGDRRAGIGGGSYDNQNFYTWLDDRQAKGFTVAQVQLFARTAENEAGYPFPGNTSASGGTGDFTQISAAYFQSLDTRMAALHDSGFVIAAHPSWLSDFNITETDAQRLSRYLLARYGAYNLVWSLSGEYQYAYSLSHPGGPWALCWDYAAAQPNAACEWNSLGEAVKSYNAYGHPVSIHPSSIIDASKPEWGAQARLQSSSGEFHAQAWLDHNWLQTGHLDKRLQQVFHRTVSNYALSPAKPVVHSEGFYENIKAEGADAAEVRWQAWTALLNGAAGHTYGASGVWQFYDPADPGGQTGAATFDGATWLAALGYPGSGQMAHVRSFFEGVDWWRLEPHRDWLRVGGAVPGLPTDTDLSPPHAAAIPNELVVIYVPAGNAGKSIKMTALGAGPYTAQSFNPRDGIYAALNSGAPLTLSNGEWTLPADVYADGQDWVVLIASASATPTPTASPSPSPSATATPTATPTPTATATVTPSPSPTAPATASPTPTQAADTGFRVGETLSLNFQPDSAAVPAGYLADSGFAFGDRGNGHTYGWNISNQANDRDRNSALAADQRYDTLTHMQRKGAFFWEIAVPSGTYSVRVVAGDPSYFDSVYQIAVEGVLAVSGAPSSEARWLEGTVEVTVADGRLTLDNASGAVNNKLAFVEITPLFIGATATPSPAPTQTASPTPAAFSLKINFQLAGAPVPAGYLADSGAAFGDRGNGHTYGWNLENASARDRESANAPDQRYDTLVHMQLNGTYTWEAAVPNGTYTVRVVAGDPSYYRSVYRVEVEGVLTVDAVSSSALLWAEGTSTVTVSDGRLTLSSAPGAVGNKLAFVEISAP